MLSASRVHRRATQRDRNAPTHDDRNRATTARTPRAPRRHEPMSALTSTTTGEAMVIVGLDVGYSNLKIAAGEAGGVPQVSMRPAGAAPAQRLGERVGSGPAPADGIYVDVRGQRWIAAVEPGRLEGWQRPLHEDYATSPAYEALVKAGLVLADYRRIDQLVTGLPVSQAREPRRREALTRLLVGRHATDQGEVEVEAVRVGPAGRRVRRPGVVGARRRSARTHRDRHRARPRCRLLLGRLGSDRRRRAAPRRLRHQPGGDVGADRPGRGAGRRAARRAARAAAGRGRAARRPRPRLLLGQRVPLAPVLERVAKDACGGALGPCAARCAARGATSTSCC